MYFFFVLDLGRKCISEYLAYIWMLCLLEKIVEHITEKTDENVFEVLTYALHVLFYVVLEVGKTSKLQRSFVTFQITE